MLGVKNRKGQTGGLVQSVVLGIAGLIVTVIIAFIIISTLNGAGLLQDTRVTHTITNESELNAGTGTSVFLNGTGYETIAAQNTQYASGTFSIVRAWASTDPRHSATTIATEDDQRGWNYSIGTGNFTFDKDGVITNASNFNTTILSNLSITYTWQNLTNEEISTNSLSGNFSQGIDNVSSNISTVLLIVAIVLILAVMVVLVAAWRRMNFDSGGQL